MIDDVLVSYVCVYVKRELEGNEIIEYNYQEGESKRYSGSALIKA